MNARQLRVHVDAALRRYAHLQEDPALARQHGVNESVQAQTSLWGAKLFDRIRLPDRLFEQGSSK